MVPLIFQSGFQSGCMSFFPPKFLSRVSNPANTLYSFFFFFFFGGPPNFRVGIQIFQHLVGHTFRAIRQKIWPGKTTLVKHSKSLGIRFSCGGWGVEIAAFSPIRSAPVCHSSAFLANLGILAITREIVSVS